MSYAPTELEAAREAYEDGLDALRDGIYAWGGEYVAIVEDGDYWIVVDLGCKVERIHRTLMSRKRRADMRDVEHQLAANLARCLATRRGKQLRAHCADKLRYLLEWAET